MIVPGRQVSKRLALAAAAVLVMVTAACGKNDMRHQVRIDAGERADVPVAGSVPSGGLEPSAEDQEVFESLENPVPSDAASIERGRALFADHCAPCHGADGKGKGVLLKELGELGDLAELVGSDVSDGYLYSIIRHGGISMPAYGTDLDPRERWELVDYLRTLPAKR
ncbi:MAG: c-type cytochrome [Acidobacteriota bacterium]